MTEKSFIYDVEAVARRLLSTKFTTENRVQIEQFLEGIPENVAKEILDFTLKRELIHIIDGYAIRVKSENSKLPVIWDKDLVGIHIEEMNWYVKGYIPEKAIVMWAGKRASFKSWCALHLAISLTSGKSLFNRFETSKVSVLYIDEENGIETLKERVSKIKQGMGITENLDNLGFVSFEGIKLERQEWREKIKNFLSEHNPCVIIVDSFRRIISAEENDATEVNKVFTELIRPIIQEHNCTWILVHHLRKGVGGRSSDDIMDELRGSSELTNYADVVIIFERPPKVQNRFIFRQAKCRRAKEQPPFMIQLNWDETFNSLNFDTIGTAEEILDSIDVCCKRIMVWLEENNLVNFETKAIKTAMKTEGFSTATIERSLGVLVAQGKLLRPKRGHYLRIVETLENFEPSTHQFLQDGNEGVKDEKTT
jgi:hypothetical protein